MVGGVGGGRRHPDPPPNHWEPPIHTSSICFSFWDDLTEAEAAMMAFSCCMGTEGGEGGSVGQ